MQGTRLLDVAGGTGDIAFRFVNAVRASPLYEPSLPKAKALFAACGTSCALVLTTSTQKSHVTIADINPSMLEVGKTRAEELGMRPDGGRFFGFSGPAAILSGPFLQIPPWIGWSLMLRIS